MKDRESCGPYAEEEGYGTQEEEDPEAKKKRMVDETREMLETAFWKTDIPADDMQFEFIPRPGAEKRQRRRAEQEEKKERIKRSWDDVTRTQSRREDDDDDDDIAAACGMLAETDAEEAQPVTDIVAETLRAHADPVVVLADIHGAGKTSSMRHVAAFRFSANSGVLSRYRKLCVNIERDSAYTSLSDVYVDVCNAAQITVGRLLAKLGTSVAERMGSLGLPVPMDVGDVGTFLKQCAANLGTIYVFIGRTESMLGPRTCELAQELVNGDFAPPPESQALLPGDAVSLMFPLFMRALVDALYSSIRGVQVVIGTTAPVLGVIAEAVASATSVSVKLLDPFLLEYLSQDDVFDYLAKYCAIASHEEELVTRVKRYLAGPPCIVNRFLASLASDTADATNWKVKEGKFLQRALEETIHDVFESTGRRFGEVHMSLLSLEKSSDQPVALREDEISKEIVALGTEKRMLLAVWAWRLLMLFTVPEAFGGVIVEEFHTTSFAFGGMESKLLHPALDLLGAAGLVRVGYGHTQHSAHMNIETSDITSGYVIHLAPPHFMLSRFLSRVLPRNHMPLRFLFGLAANLPGNTFAKCVAMELSRGRQSVIASHVAQLLSSLDASCCRVDSISLADTTELSCQSTVSLMTETQMQAYGVHIVSWLDVVSDVGAYRRCETHKVAWHCCADTSGDLADTFAAVKTMMREYPAKVLVHVFLVLKPFEVPVVNEEGGIFTVVVDVTSLGALALDIPLLCSGDSIKSVEWLLRATSLNVIRPSAVNRRSPQSVVAKRPQADVAPRTSLQDRPAKKRIQTVESEAARGVAAVPQSDPTAVKPMVVRAPTWPFPSTATPIDPKLPICIDVYVTKHVLRHMNELVFLTAVRCTCGMTLQQFWQLLLRRMRETGPSAAFTKITLNPRRPESVTQFFLGLLDVKKPLSEMFHPHGGSGNYAMGIVSPRSDTRFYVSRNDDRWLEEFSLISVPG